jgi:lipooligosaccharide transport system permease protein
MATEARTPELGRLERSALTGVLVREVVNFSSYWRSATFSSTVEPTIYLLAFGFGFGSLVSKVGGYDYVEFVGTGTVATAVLFSSVFPGMFSTFVKHRFQRTYDAILAAPVDTEELVTAEALWIAIRAGVYGCAPLLVAIAFGLDPRWQMVFIPAIGFVSGYGWAAFGITVAATMKSIDNFSYVISAVVTPLFLVAGTFFPISGLPEWAQHLAQLNPLYHTVQLVRHAAVGFDAAADLWNVAALLIFGVAAWRIAIWRMSARLILRRYARPDGRRNTREPLGSEDAERRVGVSDVRGRGGRSTGAGLPGRKDPASLPPAVHRGPARDARCARRLDAARGGRRAEAGRGGHRRGVGPLV